MEKHGVRILQAAVLALLLSLTATRSSQAETGAVRVVFTKGGFIVGVGGGRVCSRSAAIITHSGFPE